MQFDYPIEQADTAFGQAINVTAMQMLQGFTAIANNGQMVKPQFVKKVVNPNTGKRLTKWKPKSGRPVKAKTTKEVRKLMQDVVYKPYGIGSDFKLKVTGLRQKPVQRKLQVTGTTLLVTTATCIR